MTQTVEQIGAVLPAEDQETFREAMIADAQELVALMQAEAERRRERTLESLEQAKRGEGIDRQEWEARKKQFIRELEANAINA